MVAGRLMIWGTVISICRYNHLFVAHEINIKWYVDGELQNIEDEDVGSVDRGGEAANVRIVHVPQVTVQLVKHNGLVQITWCKVGRARGGEGHAHRLGQRVELQRKQGGVLVLVRTEGDFWGGEGQRVLMARVHNWDGSFPIWAVYRREVTQGGWRAEINMNATALDCKQLNAAKRNARSHLVSFFHLFLKQNRWWNLGPEFY